MAEVDKQRRLAPYPHPDQDCTEDCKARGTCTYMYPQSSTFCNQSQLNYLLLLFIYLFS